MSENVGLLLEKELLDEIAALSNELSANATVLARQCDMAREAERECLAAQRRIKETEAEIDQWKQAVVTQAEVIEEKEKEQNISLDVSQQDDILRVLADCQVALKEKDEERDALESDKKISNGGTK